MALKIIMGIHASPNQAPLVVVTGHGNNGYIKTEGMHYRNILC